MTRRVTIEPHDPPARRPVAQAVEEIRRGAVVAYPTDTLYALGCDLQATKSAERLYRAKDMGKSRRLAFLCVDLTQASIYGHFGRTAFRLAQRIFPGPYTIVVPATREVPRLLLDHRRRTVGLRVPGHPVTQALLRELGRPLLSTSALTAADEACRDGDDVIEHFGEHLDLVIDSGETPGEPSTVLAIEGERVEVLREGLGSLDVLR